MQDPIVDNLKDFTYDGYVRFLRFLKRRYEIGPLSQFSRAKDPYLILRHDVDGSLEAALKMARIDNDLEIRSTFFVMFSYKFYNILEKEDLAMLREISKLGHEIGLHYDIAVYRDYGRDLEQTLKKEIELLEYLVDSRVLSIACHNPSINKDDPFLGLRGYINAYNSKYCENYTSDSCRAWCLKDLSRLLNSNLRRVQLLIHPFLWTDDVCGRDAILQRLFRKIEEKNEDYKLKWLDRWRNSPKVKEYDEQVNKFMRYPS